MKRQPPPSEATRGRKRARAGVSAEDAQLWHSVASRIEPLRKAKPRVPDVEAERSGPAFTGVHPAPTATRTTKPAAILPAPAAPALPKAAPLAAIDRRKARQLAKGRLEIGDRLDLHGMTQAAAQRQLVAFIGHARARGIATVLVITGKGSSTRRSDAGFGRHDHGESERGVLRRAVPMWLESPGLREHVVGFGAAHLRHGGDGAIYIHLRKPPTGRRR